MKPEKGSLRSTFPLPVMNCEMLNQLVRQQIILRVCLYLKSS